MMIDPQRVASIVRQIAAYAALVFAGLTSALGSIKLTPAASTVLGIFGTVILGLEHSNWSPGGPKPPTPPTP